MPEWLPVYCGGMKGMFHVPRLRVLCRCLECTRLVRPTAPRDSWTPDSTWQMDETLCAQCCRRVSPSRNATLSGQQQTRTP